MSSQQGLLEVTVATMLPLSVSNSYMAGITQEVHPYQPNVTKSCSLLSFSRAQFFTKLHGSFYIFPIRGSVRSVAKKINKKVSGKNLNLTSKIGIFYSKIFLKSQKRRLCEAIYAPQNASPKFFFVSILQDFPLAMSWYTPIFLQVPYMRSNLENKIVCFQKILRKCVLNYFWAKILKTNYFVLQISP